MDNRGRRWRQVGSFTLFVGVAVFVACAVCHWKVSESEQEIEAEANSLGKVFAEAAGQEWDPDPRIRLLLIEDRAYWERARGLSGLVGGGLLIVGAGCFVASKAK